MEYKANQILNLFNPTDMGAGMTELINVAYDNGLISSELGLKLLDVKAEIIAELRKSKGETKIVCGQG